MPDALDMLLRVLLVGIGATIIMDVWVAIQKRVLRMSALDYALVGRWIGHMPQGRFRHASIVAAPPVRGERMLGWLVHYAVGVAFAAVLVVVWGSDWVRNPSIGPALTTGLASVAAPFLVMQPALGFGIAASRTPKPNVARLRSVVTHLSFGFGLFLAGSGVSLLLHG